MKTIILKIDLQQVLIISVVAVIIAVTAYNAIVHGFQPS